MLEKNKFQLVLFEFWAQKAIKRIYSPYFSATRAIGEKAVYPHPPALYTSKIWGQNHNPLEGRNDFDIIYPWIIVYITFCSLDVNVIVEDKTTPVERMFCRDNLPYYNTNILFFIRFRRKLTFLFNSQVY